MSTCFVIMPISTPEHSLADYNGDREHFHHVLEHLFWPALKLLDFGVIPPSASGSDLIQAEIIRNLETSDLVLCDMSTLNPNVFFELGIRTALDKPVCMVSDEMTPTIPFDTSIINFHTYSSKLEVWTLPGDVEKLGEHISNSVERSQERNMLWKYFGLTAVATPPAQETGTDAKLDRLVLQVEALSRRPSSAPPTSAASNPVNTASTWTVAEFRLQARRLLESHGFPPPPVTGSGKGTVTLSGENIPHVVRNQLHDLAEDHGIRLRFQRPPPADNQTT